MKVIPCKYIEQIPAWKYLKDRYNYQNEGGTSDMSKYEQLEQIRTLTVENNNIIQKLYLQSVTEEMAEDISIYTGMDSYDVCQRLICTFGSLYQKCVLTLSML